MLEVLDFDVAVDVDRAVNFLKEGRVIASPTETVFGLLADASNEQAICKVYQIKNRPLSVPLSIVIADPEMLNDLSAKIWPVQKKLMLAFWPGPLTLLFEHKPGILAKNCLAGKSKFAVRVPSHKSLLKLLYAFDGPLVCPSANYFGDVSTSELSVVQKAFSQSDVAAVGYTNKEQLVYGLESTLVDVVSSNEGKILRLGAISKADLERVSGSSFHWELPESSRSWPDNLNIISCEDVDENKINQDVKVVSVYPCSNFKRPICVLSNEKDTAIALKVYSKELQKFIASLNKEDQVVFVKGIGGTMMEALNNRVKDYLIKALSF